MFKGQEVDGCFFIQAFRQVVRPRLFIEYDFEISLTY